MSGAGLSGDRLPTMCRWFGHSFQAVLSNDIPKHGGALTTVCRRCGRTPEQATEDGGYERW